MSKTAPSSSSSTQHYESNKSRRHRQDDLVPVDTGLIRCICPSTEDDGFTIQCERCLVWQHAYCVKITHATIPDHYLCDQCSKRKRPKLSKRIPISKKKLRKLDSEGDPSFNSKKKKHVKSRIISRYVHPIFREAKERWSTRWKQQVEANGPLLYDHGPFVTMDSTTLLTKGVLIDTPVSNQGLFATRPIPSLRYLMEVTGDVLLKSEFKFDPANDFVILGTPLSHIMFYPTLDLCIDTRQFGNKARYIRRSCHPNAELRNVVLPHEDKSIHLGLFARHLIEKGQEVTISWSWQRGHILWKENMNWHHQHKLKQGQGDEGHQVIDEEEERRRKSTIKIMLDRFEKEFGSCACLNKRRCLIEQLRRQIAPPKEKPIFKFPVSVNVLPTKPILLKPRKLVNRGGEESLDIDVTSNSPTLAASKDASDDELLDVEGDIDIGDDLPAKDNLSLLDDNSSDDDDNADLSSLSSLSSLSVFEESGNDMTDEENRLKSRRKKNSSRHHGKSSHHRNNPSPPVPVTPVAPSVLPRKKLWMRDYLNKNIASSDQTIKSPEISTEQTYTTAANMEANNKSPPPPFNVNNSNPPLIVDVVNTMEIDETVTIENISEKVLPVVEAETHPIVIENTTAGVDMADAEDIAAEKKMEIEFDIDDGELSDASTILLDEEELRQVYRRESVDQAPVVTDKKAVDVSDEEILAIVDKDIHKNAAANTTSEKKDITMAVLEEAAITDNESKDAVPELNITENDQQEKPPNKENRTAELESSLIKDNTGVVVAEDIEKKPPIRKISLQEYLSFKQQQQKSSS